MLHYEAVSAECLKLIKDLMQIPVFGSFRLVGGTALALQKGHRLSVDVDLFSGEPFDNKMILESLEAYFYPDRPENIRTFPFGIFCSIFDIKTDFIYWGYSFKKEPVIIENIRMAHPLEIFAMKLVATGSRRTRKDYVDIALLLNEYSLIEAIDIFEIKYPEYDSADILKQLIYFEEAENTPMPKMLIPISWEEAKDKITKAVKDYWQDRLNNTKNS